MLRRLFSHYIADEVRPMLRLAIPLVLAELGWMTMGIVDTMMVGRQADSAVAIGAVSLGSIAYYVVAIFGTGLMLGLDTLVSHSYGAGDLHDAHRSLVNGVYLSLGLAPVLMGVVRLWEPVLRSLAIQQSVLNQAIPYLRALNWSTLPLLLYFVFRRYLQGIDLAKPVMFSLVTANLVNVAGNWALIYGHLGHRAMGTVGSGWSTCAARTYMAAVLIGYCVYHDLRYKTGLRHASPWPHLPRVWRLLSLGFPAAMQLGLEVAVFAVATGLIGRLGSDSVGEPPDCAEYRELHVYGAARTGISGGGARGTSARARRCARREPRGLDRDRDGRELHDVHGAGFLARAARACAYLYARPGGDPCGEQFAVRRRVLPAV